MGGGIVQNFHMPVTNGILEGIHSKVQLTKRRAGGYRNPKNFINMIYFTCAKHNFDDYPYKTL
jgi:transposase